MESRRYSLARISSLAQEAPVVATAEIRVFAPRPMVFETLTDIASWPAWNRDVRATTVERGGVGEGTRFEWKAGPSTIHSEIEDFEPPRLVVWSGRTLGIRAKHAFELVDLGGSTRVATVETWEGPLATLFPARFTRILQGSLVSGLEQLRVEAERRARAGAADAAPRLAI